MGIPERLVEIREAHGYTRKRLAEELGRPYATVTKYETGEREPGHTYIIEIAKKFGVTTDYILGIKKSPAPTEADTGDEDAGSKVLMGYYHQLNEAGQQELVDYAEGLTYMPKYKKCDSVSEEETEVG